MNKQLNNGLVLVSHALCPYVQRAAIALAEKQVAFERIDIDLREKPQWFLDLSPLGKTPVLVADGQPIFESAVICEYLEDVYGPALHPAGALERARHRAWVEVASDTLNGIWRLYSARDEAAFADAAAELRRRFEQLEQVLAAGPYFAGAAFSLVDAAFAPALRYFDVFDGAIGADLFEGLPKVRAWRDALAARPSVQGAVGRDYPALLRDFAIRQDGVMGERLRTAARMEAA